MFCLPSCALGQQPSGLVPSCPLRSRHHRTGLKVSFSARLSVCGRCACCLAWQYRSLEALHFLEAAGARFGAVSQLGGQSVARTHSPPAGASPVGLEIMNALQHSVQQQGNIHVRRALRAGVQACLARRLDRG